jgi:hypothetical protein
MRSRVNGSRTVLSALLFSLYGSLLWGGGGASLGAAIDTASNLIDDGTIVWRIKGLDGLTMERDAIELERLRRQALRMKSKFAA